MDSVVHAWMDINWENVQLRIEEEVRAIGYRQDADEVARKVLLDESNLYRANTDKESRKVAVPLIKAFQKEVDRLTSKGRASEAALIDICSQLTDIPDPTGILVQSPIWKVQAEKTNNAIEEADQLRKSLSQLHSEFSDLTNQDVTIRQLRDSLKQLESDHEKELEKVIVETERSIKEDLAAREFETNMRSDKLKQDNVMLEKKVSELEAQIRDAERRMDTARVAATQRESLESEQMDILTRDLEASKRRVVSLESDVSRLSAELSEAQSSAKRGGLEDIAALGGLMKEKDEQIARLLAENRRLSEAIEVDAKKAQSRLDELQRDLKKQKSSGRDLELKLHDQADYEAIKKELRLLREIEFGEAAEANQESIERLGETVQSLDRLLAEKNRRLQNDNAQLRVANERYQGDDVMKAILAGSHQVVVDTVSKKVGKEIAEKYVDRDSDIMSALNQEITRSKRTEQVSQKTKPVLEHSNSEDSDDNQNLFRILLNMGCPIDTATTAESAQADGATSPDTSKAEIPFDQFRYSPKLSNYTGEPAKSAKEVKTIEDLQTLVAANIRKLGSRALNTAEIAKQCKRLMVSYNIGQRLFAKYVMNQVVKSQGSLSELLSKPRHWNKLTDKGREAFRRIYGWISDDNAIDMLCSLSPRRVWPGGDSEQKVEHPAPESLWEANSAKLPPDELDENKYITPKKATSAREDQYRLAGTSQAANSGTSHRNSRWRHDDIPKEKIMSIFQTELAKIREQESSLEKAITSRSFGNGQVRRVDEISSSYHEMTHSERMASINHAHQVMTSRMRSGLSPITQQQLEMFGTVDTEDVVRQIKEFLSMNSISQRQFGEHVLGLSQGSVSDLLARPKQWSQLTQKGREPFIRMKLFMREVAQSAEKSRKENGKSENGIISCETKLIGDLLFDNNNGITVKQEIIDDTDEPMSEFDKLLKDEEEEVDTTDLTKKVRDKLHLHGISQRTFGEHVLGISAGGCSELLCRPRCWSSLNSKAKEPYERMRAWLLESDGHLKLIAKEKLNPQVEKIEIGGKRASDPNYEPSPPRKVQRTVITDQQKEALRFVFQHEHHPSQKTVELLSAKLNLNIRTVNNWFHNHRTRQKASLKEGKIYAPAVPTAPNSKNWQQDLAEMLDNVSRNSLLDDVLPTMVPITELFSRSSFDDDMAPLTPPPAPENHKQSQLDRAVARMMELAAAKAN